MKLQKNDFTIFKQRLSRVFDDNLKTEQYWSLPSDDNSNAEYAPLSVKEDRIVLGRLNWNSNNKNKHKSREGEIAIEGKCIIKWFSIAPFKYLILPNS